jgi:hypothetical protein
MVRSRLFFIRLLIGKFALTIENQWCHGGGITKILPPQASENKFIWTINEMTIHFNIFISTAYADIIITSSYRIVLIEFI